MSWRVVVVTKRCKLEYKLGYMVCRGEETKKIFIQDISTLIVESTAVALTSALLLELSRNNVNILFCDDKHNPYSQLISFNGRYNSSGILKKQLAWDDARKQKIWTDIVRLKLERQRDLLRWYSLEQADIIDSYLIQLVDGDLTNREGHSAKVYFDALFGMKFKRDDESFVNSALNYGYSIILSAFNREIVADGYNTQIGLFHRGESNFYNLSCDLMEPFRPIVDRFVFDNKDEFTSEYKHKLCDLLNLTVRIGGENNTLANAIGIYCKSVFNALDDGNHGIICYEL